MRREPFLPCNCGNSVKECVKIGGGKFPHPDEYAFACPQADIETGDVLPCSLKANSARKRRTVPVTKLAELPFHGRFHARCDRDIKFHLCILFFIFLILRRFRDTGIER